MGSFDYLLGSNPIKIPNPLSTAQQGLTLADLASGLQQKKMLLAAQQQYAQAVPLLAAGVDINQIGQQFPLAYAKILADKKANDLTQAQIGKENATAEAQKANAFKDSIQVAGNMASTLAQKAQSGQPLSPMDKAQLAAQSAHAFAIAGYDPKSINVPSVMAPDSDWTNFAQLIAGSASNPEQQANIWKIGQMTPVERQKVIADTNKTNVDASLAPFQAQTGRISANASASNAQTDRLKFLNPEPVANAVTGGLAIPQRVIGSNGQVSTTFAPAMDTTGQPVQTSLNAGQKAQVPGLEQALKDSQTAVMQAQGVQRVIPAIRALAQSGYNGPLAASDTGKEVLNGLAAAGMLTPDQVTKLGNMRASDAMTAELLGPMARQFNSRGSNAAMKFAQSVKPGSENALDVRLAMIDALGNDANNVINTEKARQGYAASHPSDLGLTGFTPPQPAAPTQTSSPAQAAKAQPSNVGKIMPVPGGMFTVTDPDGGVHAFKSEAAALEFKNLAHL